MSCKIWTSPFYINLWYPSFSSALLFLMRNHTLHPSLAGPIYFKKKDGRRSCHELASKNHGAFIKSYNHNRQWEKNLPLERMTLLSPKFSIGPWNFLTLNQLLSNWLCIILLQWHHCIFLFKIRFTFFSVSIPERFSTFHQLPSVTIAVSLGRMEMAYRLCSPQEAVLN